MKTTTYHEETRMTTTNSAAAIPQFRACDLSREAEAAVQRGETVERRTGRMEDGMTTELLIVSTGRAGLVTNGDATWGEWLSGDVLLPDDPETLDDGTAVYLDVNAARCNRNGADIEKQQERVDLADEIVEAMDDNGMLSASSAARIAGETRPELHQQTNGEGLARAMGCLAEFRTRCERAAAGDVTLRDLEADAAEMRTTGP